MSLLKFKFRQRFQLPEEPIVPPLRAVIVTIAERFVGVHERGHNSGPEVELFQKWAGGADSVKRRDAWCAAFCDYVYEQACLKCGVDKLLNIGLSVPRLKERAKKLGLLYSEPHKVQPGDLWIWKQGDRYRHVEIVTGRPVAGFVPTIGGNTSAGTGSVNEGDGVYRRRRPCTGNLFVRLA